MKQWISWCSKSEIIMLRTRLSNSSNNILLISKRSWKDCNWQYLNVKKINRNIRATAVYILNDFKRAHNKIYFDFSASTQKNFHAADLMIKNMILIKKFQANAFSNDEFVKSFSVTASRIDIIEINISTSSTKIVVFKFSTLKIASVISRKAL